MSMSLHLTLMSVFTPPEGVSQEEVVKSAFNIPEDKGDPIELEIDGRHYEVVMIGHEMNEDFGFDGGPSDFVVFTSLTTYERDKISFDELQDLGLDLRSWSYKFFEKFGCPFEIYVSSVVL